MIVKAPEIRRIIIPISPFAVGELCKNRKFEITGSPIPDDAKLTGVYFDNAKNVFLLHFEHESFDPVREGEPIPIHEAKIEYKYDYGVH